MKRYENQLKMPQIGEEGQARLRAARVSVIGAGGLGTPLLTYLAAAGVGSIRLIDFDVVAISNLNRQFFYTEEDIGRSKALLAKAFLERQNPDTRIEALTERIERSNVEALLGGSDLVIDCVDNIATRLLVNDFCVRSATPLVEAGISGFYGFVFTVEADAPCLRCLGFEHMPEPVGKEVLGATAAVVGSLQASEALKILLAVGRTLKGRLLHYDGLASSFDELTIQKSRDCPWHGQMSDTHQPVS